MINITAQGCQDKFKVLVMTGSYEHVAVGSITCLCLIPNIEKASWLLELNNWKCPISGNEAKKNSNP